MHNFLVQSESSTLYLAFFFSEEFRVSMSELTCVTFCCFKTVLIKLISIYLSNWPPKLKACPPPALRILLSNSFQRIIA